jgi:hypothetical protein
MKASLCFLDAGSLLNGLSQTERRNLLTFLLMPEPLQPAEIEISRRPTTSSHDADGSTAGRGNQRHQLGTEALVNRALCPVQKTHGPGEHDYPLWQQRWSKLLALAEKVSVESAWEWPTLEQFEKADAIVLYSNNPGWSPARAQKLDAFLQRGGGLVYIHYAVDGHAHCDELAQRIGLAWRGGASAFSSRTFAFAIRKTCAHWGLLHR